MPQPTGIPIPGFPGYEITRNGDVTYVIGEWRHNKHVLKQSLDPDGYPSVRIMLGNTRKRVAVHRLVARAYLPPCPSDRHEVRHLDGDRLRPDADNLAWGTPAENAADREMHGRTARGPKLSEAVRRGLAASRSWEAGDPTPGPWRAEKHIVIAANGAARLDILGFNTTLSEDEANARLIAAAPDMLNALQAVNKLVSEAAMTGFNYADGDWAERLFHSQQATSQAIRKAEGR